MDSIITYLLLYNQYLVKTICELLLFISKYIPLKQMSFDDSNSPEYQKFKVDKLPTILKFEKVDYKLLLTYIDYLVILFFMLFFHSVLYTINFNINFGKKDQWIINYYIYFI